LPAVKSKLEKLSKSKIEEDQKVDSEERVLLPLEGKELILAEPYLLLFGEVLC